MHAYEREIAKLRFRAERISQHIMSLYSDESKKAQHVHASETQRLNDTIASLKVQMILSCSWCRLCTAFMPLCHMCAQCVICAQVEASKALESLQSRSVDLATLQQRIVSKEDEVSLFRQIIGYSCG